MDRPGRAEDISPHGTPRLPAARLLRARLPPELGALGLRRIRPAWAVLILVLAFALTGLAIRLSLGPGRPADQFRPATGAGAPPLILLAPILEETGWRGYGVDSLRAHAGVLRSTLLVGLLWSFWRAPPALVPGTCRRQLASMPTRSSSRTSSSAFSPPPSWPTGSATGPTARSPAPSCFTRL